MYNISDPLLFSPLKLKSYGHTIFSLPLLGWRYLNKFVVTGHSVWRHTWVLMGPDSNEMLKPGYKSPIYIWKHAGCVVYENKERERDLKSRGEGKEDHCHSQQIKFYCQPFGTWESRFFIQSQFLLRHSKLYMVWFKYCCTCWASFPSVDNFCIVTKFVLNCMLI